MASVDRRAWVRLLELNKPFLSSPSGPAAIRWIVALIVVYFALSGLNVANSFVLSGFMTAIEQREPSRMYVLALVYVGVFLASSVAAALERFSEERLGLLWREWLTSLLIDRYLAHGAYRRINDRDDIDNPDQRITEDVKTFTTTMLSIALIVFNSAITFLAFAGILWTITPTLLFVAVGYSIVGTLLSMYVGGKLVGLNVRQLQKEANLRYDLVRVREHSEAIGLQSDEGREKTQLNLRLTDVVQNFRSLTLVNRNLAFFINMYNYLTQIIPVLVVAPLYISGKVAFGVITQSALAFSQILGAFSLIVSQFEKLSSFAAVVQRLGALRDALEPHHEEVGPAFEAAGAEKGMSFDSVTLAAPRDGRVLVKDLSLDLPVGKRLLIHGPADLAKSALLRATAGLWGTGGGRIVSPPRDEMHFLPEQPYLRRGPLREQLIRGLGGLIDERMTAALKKVGLNHVLDRLGGVDASRDWPNLLSAGEKQIFAVARLLLANPRFALLDHSTSALDPAKARRLYEILSQTSITYYTVGDDPGLPDFHDAILELADDGAWTVRPAKEEIDAKAPRGLAS